VWLFDQVLSDEDVADFEAWCFGRMASIVERKGFGALDRRAFDVRRVSDDPSALSDYLVKIEDGWSPGLELARGDVKRGRGPQRVTPFELLGWLVETGEARPLYLWQEFERATKGKPALRFSPGLRRELLGDELGSSDEELAAACSPDLTYLRALVEVADWNQLVGRGQRAAFLSEVENLGKALFLLAALAGQVVEPLDLKENR
jgi:hypothetical protein